MCVYFLHVLTAGQGMGECEANPRKCVSTGWVCVSLPQNLTFGFTSLQQAWRWCLGIRPNVNNSAEHSVPRGIHYTSFPADQLVMWRYNVKASIFVSQVYHGAERAHATVIFITCRYSWCQVDDLYVISVQPFHIVGVFHMHTCTSVYHELCFCLNFKWMKLRNI